MKEGAVLLVGAESSTWAPLQLELEAKGFAPEVVTQADDALAIALAGRSDVVVADLGAKVNLELELLGRFRKAKPELPVIITTAGGTAKAAIEASKLGAYAYLTKPFDTLRLVDLVASAAVPTRAPNQNSQPEAIIADGLVGFSVPMQTLYKELGQAARTDWNVLIMGETGTGKELVARAIHEHSDRANQPFVPVNCCAIAESLFESELFGHEPGSFTGARGRRIGCFEQAHKGTLFLDEIGDLDAAMQVKLLRVLQEKRLRRIGSHSDIAVEVRVIAATNRDLEGQMQTMEFRQDLFQRLGVLMIKTPGLREHLEDIEPLAKEFLQRIAAETGRNYPSLEPKAFEFLRAQLWPGNVRQLENVIRRAFQPADNGAIESTHVRAAYGRAAGIGMQPGAEGRRYRVLLGKARSGEVRNVLRLVIQDAESALISEAIAFTEGNQARAASLLGMGRTTLRSKLRKLGLLDSNETGSSDDVGL
ncbi:MAG TPA: sigma-54 dependent transcriptional regulator [Candidatus Limnocylindrales bacterium]|nr:sigma-54 dependent transcriptional regulator [Candidatus Limnocylindrales bacterium]